jgi:hypothetical protein
MAATASFTGSMPSHLRTSTLQTDTISQGAKQISRTLTRTGRILKFFNANTDVFGGRQSIFGRFRSALERCFFFDDNLAWLSGKSIHVGHT